MNKSKRSCDTFETIIHCPVFMARCCIEYVKLCLPRRKPTPITPLAPPEPLKIRSNSSVLTLPFPQEVVGQGRKTNAQSQSLLLSSLPIEIRMLIWKLCIGGNTLHLDPFRFGPRGRHTRFKHQLCLVKNPELPLRRHCCSCGYHHNEFKAFPLINHHNEFRAFSLIVTCRQT